MSAPRHIRRDPWKVARTRSGRIGLPPMMILSAVVLLASAAPLMLRRTAPVPQPVAFSHLKHTDELQLACDFCHKYVRTGAHSGLPDRATCAICHAAPLGTSEEAVRFTELVQNGDPIRFNKLFRLPSHVYYTHRRHVTIAELECETCHDEISSTEVPPERPLVKIDMAFCVDCHREREVTTDCTACHR